MSALPPDLDARRGVAAFAPPDRTLPPARPDAPDGVRVDDLRLPRLDDPPLHVRLHRPAAGTPRRRVLVLHGGGFITDSPASADAVLREWTTETGHLFASPVLRLAPEAPFPAALEDAWAALAVVADEVETPGGSTRPLVVLGVSSGAALAVGVALRARAQGWPRITALVLACPALDDRQLTRSSVGVTDPRVWNAGMVRLMWRAYLGDRAGGRDVPAEAAPARATDLTGLPPTTITLNEHDPLRDEGLEFAQRLWAAGVPTDVHLMPGTFHGSMGVVPEAPISRQELAHLRRGLDRG